MAIDELILKSQGNVDIQVGGPGNAWVYFSPCASMSGPSVSLGAIETRWCQDPNNAEKFVRSVRFRTAPDDITFDLMTKLTAVNSLADLECPFGIRARFLNCSGSRNDPAQYAPIMLGYTPAQLESKDYDDLVITDPGDNDEIVVTAPINASYEYIIEKMTSPARVGSAAELGAEAIVSLVLCGDASCGGSCGAPSDGCDTLYALTTETTGIYATPTLLVGSKNNTTNVWTWVQREVVGLTGGDADIVRCAGSRILVSSNSGSDVVYSDDAGVTWTSVALASPPSANVNALFARTSQEVWVAAEAGYLFKSTDGGLSYDTILNGNLTSENYTAVFAYSADLIYVVGESGVVFKTSNGGSSWSTLTDELALANTINLLDVRVPDNRPNEVYVATNDGRIFRSINTGTTWTAVSFSGSGAGTVDKIVFTGPANGEIMFIMHTDSSNRTRLLRDNSGGNGGSDVELVYNFSDVIAAGVELDDFTVCNPNDVFLGGALNTAFPTIIQAQ